MIDPTFDALKRREHAMLDGDLWSWTTERLLIAATTAPWKGMISANGKTGVSLDFPVGHTCTPTPMCSAVCYAKRPGAPVTWEKSVLKRLRNFLTVQRCRPEVVAHVIEDQFNRARRLATMKRAEQNFLRINGTGDLFPESVTVLNLLLARMPKTPIWVVSRKPDLARLLTPAPNLWLQLSLDSSTPAGKRAELEAVARDHPRAYLSYLRTSASDDTRGAPVIFNEKGHRGHINQALPVESKRACPVDSGRLELGNIKGQGGTACAQCRRCFSSGVLAHHAEEVAA